MKRLCLFLSLIAVNTNLYSSDKPKYAQVSTVDIDAASNSQHGQVAPRTNNRRRICCAVTTLVLLTAAAGIGYHELRPNHTSDEPPANPGPTPAPHPNPNPSPTPHHPTPAPINPTCVAIKTYPFAMNQTLDPKKYYLQALMLQAPQYNDVLFRPVCNTSATAEDVDKDVFHGIMPECDGLPAAGLELRTEMRFRPFPLFCNDKQEVERRNKLFFEEIKASCLRIKTGIKDSTPRCNLTTIAVNVVKPTPPPAAGPHHHNHNHDARRQNAVNNGKALKRASLSVKSANGRKSKR